VSESAPHSNPGFRRHGPQHQANLSMLRQAVGRTSADTEEKSDGTDVHDHTTHPSPEHGSRLVLHAKEGPLKIGVKN
jgi:hypothetical protein